MYNHCDAYSLFWETLPVWYKQILFPIFTDKMRKKLMEVMPVNPPEIVFPGRQQCVVM